jgi:type I restriction-modification system DNA methylase subunit
MEEHRYIDELESQLLGAGFTFPGVENHILENNIFGVDINEESIEIAKLSLWLRTAQRGRKLTSLNNNIKCGNSLIDDPEVAGEKAFSWQQEFPTVFEKGGFDVVIGNPPYVRPSNMSNLSKEFYWEHYKSFKAKADLYSIFMEKGIIITKNSGLTSFIVPHTWVSLESFEEIRKIILEKTNIFELVRLPKKVFSDATVETCLFIFQKTKIIHSPNSIKIKYVDQFIEKELFEFEQGLIHRSHLFNFQLYTDFNTKPILDKVNSFKSLDNFVELKYGFKTGDDNKFISNEKLTNDHYPFIRSGDLKRYYFPIPNEYVWYMPQLMRENKDTARPGDFERFNEEKIIVSRMGKGIEVAYDNSGLFVKDAMLLSKKNNVDLKSITGILNSKLINFFYKEYFNTIDVLKNALLSLPINFDIDKFSAISKKVDLISNSIIENRNQSKKFITFCISSISGFESNNNLSNWFELTYKDFISEANKVIKKNGVPILSKKEEFELMELFEENKKKVLELKTQIDQTDKEIDRMVYELYGLTDEEIKIVEGN